MWLLLRFRLGVLGCTARVKLPCFNFLVSFIHGNGRKDFGSFWLRGKDRRLHGGSQNRLNMRYPERTQFPICVYNIHIYIHVSSRGLNLESGCGGGYCSRVFLGTTRP